MVPSLRSHPAHLRRTYVLDTNVLLYDPNALSVFEEHDLVLPIIVIEEIDRFKRDLNETGRNARLISRQLDALRAEGSFTDGVELPKGGRLMVALGLDARPLPQGFVEGSNDNRILAIVLKLQEALGKEQVIFVTRDVNMRLKADALGVLAEDYEHAHITLDENYGGVAERDVDPSLINEVHDNRGVTYEDENLIANQFVILRSTHDPKHTAMTRFDSQKGRLQRVGRYREGVFGIRARNKEQRFALDLLLDPDIKLVTLNGIAGTGKTLLAMACGLHQVVQSSSGYRRIICSRPIFPLGRDLGFLPGDVSEKFNPWMKPIFDNLEFIISQQFQSLAEKVNSGHTPGYQGYLEDGLLEVEPLTYIRGRSLPGQYLVIDEAQNLTPHEVKTVITRAGEGTKVVLTGDPYQIDNPYVDATSNGLTYVVENFKNSHISGHVTLRKGERSQLAELAAQLL